LWFLAKTKKNGRFADRRGKTLFIDARKLGVLVDRVHRELTDEEIRRAATTYHAWRGEKDAGKYEDILGFCKSVSLVEIKNQSYVLTPGRYVGAEEVGNDDEPFEEKMQRLTVELERQFAETERLRQDIRAALASVQHDS
jgi:type I restriction enzyme M protein